MADAQIVAAGQSALPVSYTVPNAQEIIPRAVRAVFDGTGAGGTFYPMLEIVSDGGVVVSSCPMLTQIAAGASAEVSWFPGLGAASVSAAAVKFVGARIETNAAQVVATSTNTDLAYQVVAFDTGGMANLGADARKLTVQQAGLYMVICETYWPWTTGAPGRRLNTITHNGLYSGGGTVIADDERMAVWTPLTGPGPENHSTNTSVGLIQASAGDFFASGGNQQSGANLSANGSSAGFLAAILLGGN